MKILKIIGVIVAVIIIVLGALIYFGLGKLDGFVEQMIETTGTRTLQTKVAVSGVKIQLTEGKGSVSGLSVANPEGYSNNSILRVGDVGLQIDINSLAEPVKVIKEVYITGVALRAEQKNIKDTNIEALLDNLKSSSNPSTKTSEKTTSEKTDIRLAIEKLRVGEITIDLSSQQYGDRTLTVPAYSQTGIGSKAKGLTPDQISEVIISSIMKKAKAAVTAAVKDKAKEKVEEELKEKLQESLSSEKIKSLFK